MSNSDRPIKIRTLPRSDEKQKSSPHLVPPPPKKKDDGTFPFGVLFVIAAVGLAFYILWPSNHELETPAAPIKAPASATAPHAVPVAVPPQRKFVEDGSPEALVNKYLQEAEAKREMAMKARDIENKASGAKFSDGDAIVKDDQRIMGVQMDQDNSAEKVYKDLYGKEKKEMLTPEERIQQRIEQQKWVSETERQERKQYIQNFLSEAAKEGYAIDLDENLIVVRVRKLKSKPAMTLDQMLDNLARKGY